MNGCMEALAVLMLVSVLAAVYFFPFFIFLLFFLHESKRETRNGWTVEVVIEED